MAQNVVPVHQNVVGIFHFGFWSALPPDSLSPVTFLMSVASWFEPSLVESCTRKASVEIELLLHNNKTAFCSRRAHFFWVLFFVTFSAQVEMSMSVCFWIFSERFYQLTAKKISHNKAFSSVVI